MNRMPVSCRLGASLLAAAVVALAASATASAAAFLSPPVVKASERQVFTLAVQSQKQGLQIPVRLIELFVPAGFSIDSFAPTPGWEEDWSVQSDPGHPPIRFATWARDEEDLRTRDERNEASEQDAVFQFLGRTGSSGKDTFTVRQIYSDGSVVQWGPQVRWGGLKPTAGPGPTVVARSSLGGGTSTLAIVALIVGALGLVAATAALLLQRAVRNAGSVQ